MIPDTKPFFYHLDTTTEPGKILARGVRFVTHEIDIAGCPCATVSLPVLCPTHEEMNHVDTYQFLKAIKQNFLGQARTLEQSKAEAIPAHYKTDPIQRAINGAVEIEKLKNAVHQLRVALDLVVDESEAGDILCEDGYTMSFQRGSPVHHKLLKALKDTDTL